MLPKVEGEWRDSLPVEEEGAMNPEQNLRNGQHAG
jgi:hypothetical protein